MSKSLYDEDGIDGPFNKRMDDGQKVVKVKCSHCGWSHSHSRRRCTEKLPALLKKAWSIGLEHAWDNRGHVVETFVDGKLKATQQVAEMSPWQDHNAVVVEEGIE